MVSNRFHPFVPHGIIVDNSGPARQSVPCHEQRKPNRIRPSWQQGKPYRLKYKDSKKKIVPASTISGPAGRPVYVKPAIPKTEARLPKSNPP